MNRFTFFTILTIKLLSFPLFSQEVIDIDTKRSFANPRYKIERIIPLETRSDAFLGRLINMQSYKDLFVVTDRDKIIIYNKDGKINKVLNIKGRGVGESLSLHMFAISNDYIFINNVNSKTIIKYDLKGNYIESYKFEDYFHDFNILEDKVIADISDLQNSKDKQLAIANLSTGEVENRYIDNLSPGSGIDGYPIIKKDNEAIYFAPAYTSVIYKYSKGEPMKYIKLNFTRNDALSDKDKKSCRDSDNPYTTMTKLVRERNYIDFPLINFNNNWFTIRYNRNKTPYMFIKNRKSGKDYLVDIKNEKDIIFTSYIQQESEDKFISLVEAHNFVENYKDAAKYGVTEDSNPVLLIWDFVE